MFRTGIHSQLQVLKRNSLYSRVDHYLLSVTKWYYLDLAYQSPVPKQPLIENVGGVSGTNSLDVTAHDGVDGSFWDSVHLIRSQKRRRPLLCKLHDRM